MREPTYFILLSLLGGRLHGYGIAKRADELSDGRVRLAVGTLYGALDRLVDEGHIVVDGKEKVQGRQRRYYRLTDDGRKALLAEVARLRSSLEAAKTGGISIKAADLNTLHTHSLQIASLQVASLQVASLGGRKI